MSEFRKDTFAIDIGDEFEPDDTYKMKISPTFAWVTWRQMPDADMNNNSLTGCIYRYAHMYHDIPKDRNIFDHCELIINESIFRMKGADPHQNDGIGTVECINRNFAGEQYKDFRKLNISSDDAIRLYKFMKAREGKKFSTMVSRYNMTLGKYFPLVREGYYKSFWKHVLWCPWSDTFDEKQRTYFCTELITLGLIDCGLLTNTFTNIDGKPVHHVIEVDGKVIDPASVNPEKLFNILSSDNSLSDQSMNPFVRNNIDAL
jgi:hypothetical protein